MGEATIMEVLGQFGFPILMVLWFMWRMEKRLDRQAELTAALLQATAVLAKAVDAEIEDPRNPVVRGRTEGGL